MSQNRWRYSRPEAGGEFKIEKAGKKESEQVSTPFELAKRPESLKRSPLGSPYYYNDSNPAHSLQEWLKTEAAATKGASYQPDIGVTHYMPVWLGGIHIPYATVNINLQNIVVSTPMTERRGSVHEVVSTDDYVITIRGLLIDENGEWPFEQVKKLQELFRKKRNLSLRSVITDLFLQGSDKVLIKSIPLPPSSRGTQEFEIQLVSDLVFTLDID